MKLPDEPIMPLHEKFAQLTSLIFTKAFPLITLLAKGLSNGMRWLRRAKASQYYQVIS